VIVTENGIATSDDTRRVAYTQAALTELIAFGPQTFARAAKPSAHWLGGVAKTGSLAI
jgi:beta-glucosidase